MEEEIIEVFANSVRLRLIESLSHSPRTVNELIKTCGLSQSAVSQHLAKLRQVGLVASQKEGRNVFYRLKYPQAAEICFQLHDLTRDLTG